MTNQINYSAPYPKCEHRFTVQPEDYFIPLCHAIRLKYLDFKNACHAVKHIIPGYHDSTDQEIERRTRYLG